MKISEILESADSIATYLALLGHDITFYENGSTAVKEQYKSNSTPNFKFAIINILNSANFNIAQLIHDEDLWNRFADDPEISIIYNRFVNLYNSNYDFLKTLK
jgi:hypothetical protein